MAKFRVVGRVLERPEPVVLQPTIIERTTVEKPVHTTVVQVDPELANRLRLAETALASIRAEIELLAATPKIAPRPEHVESGDDIEIANGEIRLKKKGKWGPWIKLGGGGGGLTELHINSLIEAAMADTEVDAHHELIASSGNNIIKAPASGKKLRLYAYAMHADPENADAVICGLRFGSSGTIFASAKLSQYGGVAAHSYKAGRSYIEGAVDEVLYGNLDGAYGVDINIDYTEV